MTSFGEYIVEIPLVLKEVEDELSKAVVMFPPFNSAHEGYAIIKEEVDELWEAVRNNKHASANGKQREEAIQVAAMAVRFVFDISNKGKYKNDR
jgi:hypothetical protein